MDHSKDKELFLSSRVKFVSESITLKLNEKANLLAESGYQVFNLTAGQLPFRPLPEFIEKLASELNFLKSFQYAPVAGVPELRKKIISYIESIRNIEFAPQGEFDCVLSNGAKHSIYNVLGTVVDPGDEVMILAPYWVSYPEMIKFWGGVPVVVKGHNYDAFTPPIDDIRKMLTPRTRALIINSPNNPAGIHYSSQWMKEFAELVKDYPNLILISDEIYFQLYYFDPKPTYFYQTRPELLSRTVIVDGISKSLASTGLRLGYTVGPKRLMEAMTKLQGQTTSGASSLVQRAFLGLDFDKVDAYLNPIRLHLRNNANIVREKFKEYNLSKAWYQSSSAFYYLIDFTQTPVYEKFLKDSGGKYERHVPHDLAGDLCDALLEKYGVAAIPGTDFGMPNTARISLVMEEVGLTEAMKRIGQFLSLK